MRDRRDPLADCTGDWSWKKQLKTMPLNSNSEQYAVPLITDDKTAGN